jgi:hypothetical protein
MTSHVHLEWFVDQLSRFHGSLSEGPTPECISTLLVGLRRLRDDYPSPAYLIAITVSAGNGTWKLEQKGAEWKLKWAGRGRRPYSLERLVALNDTYERALVAFRSLRMALRAQYPSVRPRSAGSAKTRAATAHYLATLGTPHAKFVRPTNGSETAMAEFFSSKLTIPTNVPWDDFCRGDFVPQELALAYVGSRFGCGPEAVRRFLKIQRSKRSTVKARRV